MPASAAKNPHTTLDLTPEATEAANRLAAAIEGITPHMADIAKNTSVIADNMDGLKAFVMKWLPWLIGIGALVFPKLSQLIQSVPLPH